MGCRLVAVSVKIGGNRRLPIGKENTASPMQPRGLKEDVSASQVHGHRFAFPCRFCMENKKKVFAGVVDTCDLRVRPVRWTQE